MPQLQYYSGKSASLLPQSVNLDLWDDFVDDTFIRVVTGESILHQPPFHEVLWEDTSESDYMSLTKQNSTAIGKQFVLRDLSDSDRGFTKKHPKQWNANDIMQWTIHIANVNNFNYEEVCMARFNVDGMTLCNMTEEEFTSRDPYFGNILYDSLQSLINGCEYKEISLLNKSLPTFNNSFSCPMLMDLGQEKDESAMTQNGESDYSTEKKLERSTSNLRPNRRPPGRPRGTRSKKKPEKKCGRLWEFIRDLLLNRDYCPSLICWDDHDQGVFRFVRSEKVAQLWGTIKENPKMTYEKLSRAMRYYYKSKVLQPVLGRRLVYKFGPTATGWRTPNPNFRLNL